MNTMFCLVSRQPMANVLPVFMYKPKNVVLFATPEEKKSADNQQNIFLSKSISVKRIDGLNAYDYVNFKQKVLEQLQKASNDVWLNVTGGTKLMAMAAYEVFTEKNKNIIYCNTDNNEIIHLYPEVKTERLSLELSIKDYLQSYGYNLVGTKTKKVKNEYIQLFDLLIEKNLLKQFAIFLDNFRSKYGSGTRISTFRDRKDKTFSVQITTKAIHLFVFDREFIFDDDRFLKGDWLEYFMQYSLINLGIKPEVGVQIVSSAGVENEIDIVFIKNYQLYLLSCKSGKKKDSNKAIYEIEALRNIAGGTFGKAFLVTSLPLTGPIQKRADELNVKTLALENIRNTEFYNNFKFEFINNKNEK